MSQPTAETPLAAHEDLTISELLDSMRTTSENRPGEQCLILGDGRHRWVSNRQVNRFITESGALQPAVYPIKCGIDRKLRHFNGF